MRRFRRILGTLLLLLGLLIGTWLINLLRWVAPLLRGKTTVTPEQLADADSQFINVQNVFVHYKQMGTGKPVFILLHGSFLSLFSWREVMSPLAENPGATTIAFDRPAFGLTNRPMWQLQSAEAENPYSPEAQADLIIALLDALGIEQAILVGNSTGGTIALLTALRHPERVQALILVGAMVYSGYPVSELPGWLRPLLRHISWLGHMTMRVVINATQDKVISSFWYDPSRLTPDILEHYKQSLQVQNADYASWELILATHHLNLEQQLDQITVPTLIISGEHDRAVPVEQSTRLAEALPQAHLVLIPECGHLPQEECPQRFLHHIQDFLNEHRLTASDGTEKQHDAYL
ncbi:MAG: alpha/beta hydrolase [Chloroflexaceae bacterium]|nr:alpha/beta hydrolase [Chloroflexaceae bacterium]